MIFVLIGLVVVGVGVYKMYKDQESFDNYTVDYINSIQETLDSLKKNDD